MQVTDAIVNPPGPERASGDPLTAARVWLDSDPVVALATVIATWGSSPVPVGGQMVIAADGRFQGSVSGGCVEAEVIYRAAEIISTGRPQTLEFGVSDTVARDAGLPCGGRIRIHLEALAAADEAHVLDRVLDARRNREPLVVTTQLAVGTRAVFDSTTTDAPPVVVEAFRSGRSHVVEMFDGEVFVHAHVPAPRLVIVGATHIGQVLAALSREMGWIVSVVDPRTAFATEDRFHDIERLTTWPDASLEKLKLDHRTAVAVVTHVDRIDDEALIAALASPSFYVGALGSRRTHAARIARLEKTGVAAADLAKIHAPIGLTIGAQGPHEIAISIIAEIVRELRQAETQAKNRAQAST